MCLSVCVCVCLYRNIQPAEGRVLLFVSSIKYISKVEVGRLFMVEVVIAAADCE